MDFSHYNRDVAFGYAENAAGEVRLTIYLGGKNVKNFTQLTGGAAEVQRLQQVIANAGLEEGHIESAKEHAAEAQQELTDYETPYRTSEEKTSDAGGFGEEIVMDPARIAEKLPDDTKIREFCLITCNNYGYENNYTRAHEEAEYITELLPALARRKAAAAGHDFGIRLESIVRQGKGTKPGMKPDPELQIFGMAQDYTGKNGELHISGLTCYMPSRPMMACPHCGHEFFYEDIRLQLSRIADGEFCCPKCGRKLSCTEVRKNLRHGEYFYKVRDIMNVYIGQDDASCISFLTDECTEERLEGYLQLAMKQEKRNCTAAFLDYKQKHFQNDSDDFLSGFELDDFGLDEIGGGAESGAGATSGVPGGAPVIDQQQKTMIFGHYAGKPLKWQILSVMGDEALVITDECIDCKNYHDKYEVISWDRCFLRGWLKNTFLPEAFTPEEQSRILVTQVNNSDNFFTEAKCGEDTEDRVFSLDIDEAEFYFDNRFLRQGNAGVLAVKNRAYVAGTGYCAWWLRTIGTGGDHAASVDYFGLPNTVGFLSNYSNAAVRPAMWVKIR